MKDYNPTQRRNKNILSIKYQRSNIKLTTHWNTNFHNTRDIATKDPLSSARKKKKRVKKKHFAFWGQECIRFSCLLSCPWTRGTSLSLFSSSKLGVATLMTASPVRTRHREHLSTIHHRRRIVTI